MAGTPLTKTIRGIGIQSPHLVHDAIAAQGAGSTASAYTETGPRPGRPTTEDSGTRIEPVISGGQVEAIDLTVRRGGLPERRGLEVLYRMADETDDRLWRGHNPASVLSGWLAAVWDVTDAHEVFDLAVTMEDQQLVLVYLEDSTTASEIRSKTFDFDGAPPAWGAEVVVSVDPYDALGAARNVSNDWLAACAIPGGRVLAFAAATSSAEGVYFAWASDDRGATWYQYAVPGHANTPVRGFDANAERARVVYFRGDLCLVLSDAAGNIQQWMSASLGQSFEFVSDLTTAGVRVVADAIPGDGGIVVGYIANTTTYPTVRVLSGAGSPISDAAAVTVDAVACSAMTVSVDGVGNIWVHATLVANPEHVSVYVSEDAGVSFVECRALWDSGDSATYIRNFCARWVRGWCVLAHAWTTNTTTAPIGSIGTLWAAGWSNITARNFSAGSNFEARWTWTGKASGLGGDNYLPIELPAGYAGWAATGTAPTLEDPGELMFASGVNGAALLLLGAGDPIAALVTMRLPSGGSSTTNDVVMDVAHADGVLCYIVRLRFDAANSRIRVLDPFAGTLGDIDGIDLTQPVQILVSMRGSSIGYGVWWRRPWESKWTEGLVYAVGSPTLTDGGALLATSQLEFGQANAAAVESRWRLAIAVPSTGTSWLDTNFGIGWEALELYSVQDFGGQATTLPRALPDVGSEAAAAFLSVRRGPAVMGETFEVLPEYDFGVHHLFAALSPSPARPWRSADLTEQKVVFDLGANNTQNIGSMWQYAMALRNTNIRTAYLERWTGAAWSTVVTYDAATGFVGLGYERAGAYVRPTAASASGGRYITRNELAGGFVLIDNGGTVYARRIVSNSPGSWVDPTAVSPTMWPEIELAGITGSEPASGSITIVWPDGCALASASGTLIAGRQPDATARYWRFRVPVQDVVDAYYQVGAFVPTTVAGLGKQWSRGFSKDSAPNTSASASRRGTRRKKARGPVADRWVLSWQDGVFEALFDQARPDYLGHTDAGLTLYPAIAARDDVWRLLRGLLRETGGGEASVIVVDEVELGPTTITDRTRWIYGTWDSSVQANQVEEQFYRLDPITVNEQV